MKKENRIRIFPLIIMGLVLMLPNSCKKEQVPISAVLTTSAVTDVTLTTATSGGNVTSDGGSAVSARGVCWSTVTAPTIANSKTTDGTGTGSFTSSITGLTAITTYYVRAYATNSAGTVYGSATSFTAEQVPDIDGNVYHTATIGTQVWMVGNLKVTTYKDGTAIPLVTNNTEWSNPTTAGYCWYNNGAPTYKNTYGALYNWYTVDTGKLCPTGWHVPTDAEWTTLTTYLGGESVAGSKLKETGSAHWQSPNAGAINESGFTALPGGYRNDAGVFSSIGLYGYWWSSSQPNAVHAWGRRLDSSGGNITSPGAFGNLDGPGSTLVFGFSVRCLRD